MIKNPPNAQPKRENLFSLYLGLTGSGKSQALKQKGDIPAKGARVVLFDPSRDHAAGTIYYDNRASFARALKEANASGAGFRVGYDGVRSVSIHEWWCKCVIAILDGKKTTYAITEELARVSLGAGVTTEAHGWLLNEGRKYGLIYHATSQFPARISKDVYDNSGIIFFGRQPPRLQKSFANDFGLDYEELKALENLQFMRWQQGKVEDLQLNYKK